MFPGMGSDLSKRVSFRTDYKYAIWEDYVIIYKVGNEYVEIYRVVNRYQDITRIFSWTHIKPNRTIIPILKSIVTRFYLQIRVAWKIAEKPMNKGFAGCRKDPVECKWNLKNIFFSCLYSRFTCIFREISYSYKIKLE